MAPQGALRLDVAYFTTEPSPGQHVEGPLTLAIAADVFIQLATLIHLAPTVTHPARALAVGGRDNPFTQHELVSIGSGSLLVGVLIPASTAAYAGLGLMLLSERIATYRVRIARKRREELLKADEADDRRRALRSARADALATQLRRPSGVRPSTMTYYDPDNPDSPLEDLMPTDFDLFDWGDLDA